MNKKILISVSAIAVLLLYIVISRVSRQPEVIDLPPWDGKADEIIINRTGSTIKLHKKEGKWVVNEEAYPADVKVVSDIENQFKNMRLADLISKKGFYNKYDLTPDKYSEVIIRKGESILRKFKIGKKSSTGRHTFVRVDDRPDIYIAEGTFDLVLNKSADDFRNKEMMRIRRESISGLTIDYQGRQFSLYRAAEKKAVDKAADMKGKKDPKKSPGPAEATWLCRGYETMPLDGKKIEALFVLFDPLRASSFLNITKESLTQHICMVQIRANQKDMTLSIFKKDNKYIAAVSESPYVFVLDSWIAEKFFIAGIDKFKADARK